MLTEVSRVSADGWPYTVCNSRLTAKSPLDLPPRHRKQIELPTHAARPGTARWLYSDVQVAVAVDVEITNMLSELSPYKCLIMVISMPNVENAF